MNRESKLGLAVGTSFVSLAAVLAYNVYFKGEETITPDDPTAQVVSTKVGDGSNRPGSDLVKQVAATQQPGEGSGQKEEPHHKGPNNDGKGQIPSPNLPAPIAPSPNAWPPPAPNSSPNANTSSIAQVTPPQMPNGGGSAMPPAPTTFDFGGGGTGQVPNKTTGDLAIPELPGFGKNNGNGGGNNGVGMGSQNGLGQGQLPPKGNDIQMPAAPPFSTGGIGDMPPAPLAPPSGNFGSLGNDGKGDMKIPSVPGIGSQGLGNNNSVQLPSDPAPQSVDFNKLKNDLPPLGGGSTAPQFSTQGQGGFSKPPEPVGGGGYGGNPNVPPAPPYGGSNNQVIPPNSMQQQQPAFGGPGNQTYQPNNNLPQTPPISIVPKFEGVQVATGPAPVMGNGAPATVVSYDERSDYIKPGETSFAAVSVRLYGTDKYGPALQEYNRTHPIGKEAVEHFAAGAKVFYVDPEILQRRYGDAMTAAPKSPMAVPTVAAPPMGQQGFVPPPAPVNQSPPAWQPPAQPFGNGPPPAPVVPVVGSGRTYTVTQGGPQMIIDIAGQTLGDGINRWREIYRLNPQINPESPIPVGTVLRMPDGN